MTDGESTPAHASRIWRIWLAAYLLITLGGGAISRLLDASAAVTMAIVGSGMLLLIPLVRSTERNQRALGCASPATERYNRRFLALSLAYVIMLFGAVTAYGRWHPQGGVAWLLALAAAAPVFGMIWTMARLLTEEDDEYLRARHVRAMLTGLGFLLLAGTAWGFAEQFNLAPHVPAWAAFPVFAIGMGFPNMASWFRR